LMMQASQPAANAFSPLNQSVHSCETKNGTNATIIGKEPGEFIADRNNISRHWMDHGAWPWITTEFYLHQTGDLKFLLEEVPYLDGGGKGTVLEHLLVQHLAAASNLGEHGNCRLENADWNDGLDMARDRGGTHHEHS